MIPRAKLSNEIFGNPLRDRVTACRKRLRHHRGSHRITLEADSTEADSPKLAQFPADSTAMRQLVSLDLAPAFGESEAGDLSESIGQEVGIT
jgi:hypothetical protein